MLIVDAQSVTNTDPAARKGYDPGKKVSGIKRHLGADMQGRPHVLDVTTAQGSDKAGALAAFTRGKTDLSRVQNGLVDGSYTGEPLAKGGQATLGATVEVAKRSDLHPFAVSPQRWVVARALAWLEKCRRLGKNCERQLNTSLQMTVLAVLALLLKRAGTGS